MESQYTYELVLGDRPLGNKYSPYPGDIIPAKLEPGEFVMNRNAVADIGVEKLKAANNASPRYPKEMSKGGFMDEINRQRQYDADKKYRRNMKTRDASLARSGSMIDAKMEKAKQLAGSISSPQLRRPTTHIDLHAIKEIPMNPEFNIDEWNGMMGPMSQNLRSYQTAYDEKQRETINREKNMFQNVPLTQGEIDRGNRTSNIMRNAQQNDKILQHQMEVKSENGRRNDEQARLQSQQGSREILESMREQAYLSEMQDTRDGFHPVTGERMGPRMKYGPDMIKGIDPKTYKSPKNDLKIGPLRFKNALNVKSYTPAQQLMEQMNQKRNKKYNLHVNEDDPAIKQIYKDNPLMELERLNRKDNLQKTSDARVKKLADETAMEYSPENLWNADIRDDMIGDPNDPSDDYGSGLANAKKRSADRALLMEQNRDIEMMNPGSQPKYVTKKGGYGATREEWIKEQQEGGARHKERMADQRMSKEGLRLGSQKEYDKRTEELYSATMNEVAHKPLPKPEKGSLRAALSNFQEGYARGKHGTLDNDYDYQTGGAVRHYGLGDFVEQGKKTWGGITQAVGGSANAIADAAGKRYGGGFRKAQNVAGERYLGETLDGFGDMDRDQQIAMSKELRDTGGVKGIMTDQEKSQMWGQGVQGVGSQIGQDVVGGVKALPGLAVGAGAATLGAGVMGVKGLGNLASAGYKGAKDWKEAGGLRKGAAKDYKDVWSGKEKGSLMQRGKKGLGLLGGLLQDASTAQGFKGAPTGYYDSFALGKGGGKKKADGTPVVPGETPSTTDVVDLGGDSAVTTPQEPLGGASIAIPGGDQKKVATEDDVATGKATTVGEHIATDARDSDLIMDDTDPAVAQENVFESDIYGDIKTPDGWGPGEDPFGETPEIQYDADGNQVAREQRTLDQGNVNPTEEAASIDMSRQSDNTRVGQNLYNPDGTLQLAPAPEASNGTMTVDDMFAGPKPLTDEEMPDFEESEYQRGGPIRYKTGGFISMDGFIRQSWRNL